MSDEPIRLKVASFNIRYGTANDGDNSWPFRRESVFEFLKHCGCDVIGLQEVLAFQLDEIREAVPWYDWVGVGREDGDADGEFAAILFDTRRVQVNYSTTFWFSDTPDVVASTSWGNELTRICTMGEFVVDGDVFHLYNLHIDHESGPSRLKSVEMLAYRIHQCPMPKPVIVTGDFNEGEQGPAVRRMLAGGFIDTFRAIHPEGPEMTTFNGWEDLTEGEKIDYVFTFGGWKIVSSEILREKPFGKFLSDHYPISATLQYPQNVSSSELHKMFAEMVFPAQNAEEYVQLLSRTANGSRTSLTWADLIRLSHPRLGAVEVNPRDLIEAIVATGNALYEDRGEEPRGGLSNFNAISAILDRMRQIVVAPDFDRSQFGKLVLSHIETHPEDLSNLYIVELLAPLIRRADLAEAEAFFARLGDRGTAYVQLIASKFRD